MRSTQLGYLWSLSSQSSVIKIKRHQTFNAMRLRNHPAIACEIFVGQTSKRLLTTLVLRFFSYGVDHYVTF